MHGNSLHLSSNLEVYFFPFQMAETRGVPRGNYDGPVHDVISMTKSVPPTPTTRGPPCPKTLTGPRNLHQSGFTLAGGKPKHVCWFLVNNLTSVRLAIKNKITVTLKWSSSYFSVQELRLMTTYHGALLRGLWHLLVDDPTLRHYPKTGRMKQSLWDCPTVLTMTTSAS